MEVFLLHHVHEFDDGHEDVKLIGVFSSREAANAALDRVRNQPGFRDLPQAFDISPHTLDETSWLEGYVTLRRGEETPLEFAQRNGAAVSPLELHERRRIMQSWRETFAGSVKTQTGKSVHLGFEWHAFSYEFARSKRGPSGLALYLAETAREVYVVPEDETDQAFVCRASRPLDFSDCQTDVLVFPPDLDWTVAFTHEQPDLGPYFSRAEWCRVDPNSDD